MGDNFTGKSYRNEKTSEQIDNNFTYHPPKDGHTETYNILRGVAKNFARAINQQCPDSREKALALTKLEEAMFWANAAVARNE